MLTDADITMMYETRAEITAKRTRSVSYNYEVGVEDEFTGELIDTTEEQRAIMSVVTEITSNPTKELVGGALAQVGDLQISAPIVDIEDIIDKVTTIVHEDVRYYLVGYGQKGIGRRNRYEMLARRVT